MERVIEEPPSLNGKELNGLIHNAASGDKKANDSLAGLIDFTSVGTYNFNFIKVDSFYLDSIKYFSVIIEYPDPILNRFAIYDTKANCYLIDKSLNGKMSSEVIDLGGLRLIKLIEQFISKDTLKLTRISFYKKTDDSINLVYRSFAGLQTPKNQFYQTVSYITSDTLKTKITVPKRYKFNKREDIFTFDSISNSYRSSEQLFDNLVYKEIENFRINVRKRQIEANP
jgi:hypothetical protein